MDEILKSEIFIAVYGKSEGVSFEEFGGLFRQVHGYNLKLSHYGYTSMRKLLNDMNTLVEVKTINGQERIRCKSPSRHHVVVSAVNPLPQATEQVSGQPRVPVPSPGQSSGPAVKKAVQAQRTSALQQKAVKLKSTNPATGKKSKEPSKSQYPQPAKNIRGPQPGYPSPGKSAKSNGLSANSRPPTSNPVPAVKQTSGPQPGYPSPGKPSKSNGLSANSRPPTSNPVPTVKQTSGPQPGYPSPGKPAKSNGLPANHKPPTSNPVPTVKQTSGPQPGYPSPGKPAKSNGLPANHKPLTSNPVPAAPAVNAAIATAAAKTKKESNTKQKTASKFLNQKSRAIIPQLQYYPGFSKPGQNKKPGLLPTPNTSPMGRPFFINPIPHAAQLGIKPNVSYASACKTNLNMNQLNHSGQQFPPNNLGFMADPRVNATNAPQSSRSEVRPSIQPTSLIKENIEQLLDQHDSGLSIFQLQKLYLMTFHQPLRFRGSTTLKHLLVELKDVVKMEGIGVQMLVYPVIAKKNPCTPATGGDQDAALQAPASLLTKKDFQKEIESNQHSADSFISQNGELHEAAQLSLRDDHILVSRLTTKNGLEQNASQESSLPQIILHSSGFSFVMEKRIHDPHNKLSEMKLPNNPGSHNKQETPSHSNMVQGPKHLQQVLPIPKASALLPVTNPPESLVSRVENIEPIRLQPHSSRNVGTPGQEASPALQTSVNSQTENSYTSEYPALPTRGNLKPKYVLPIKDPPSKLESNAQDQKKYEEVLPSNGKDVQTKNGIDKTSQDEASISQPTNDPAKTDDSDVPGTEQSAPMLSDLQKTITIHPIKSNQSQSALQKMQSEEFSDPESIIQTCILSSKLKQEFVLSPQNTPMMQEGSVEQSNPQNRWEMTSDQEDMSTWQTSQKQACCIL